MKVTAHPTAAKVAFLPHGCANSVGNPGRPRAPPSCLNDALGLWWRSDVADVFGLGMCSLVHER